jgi:hypothetical protein
MLWEDASNLSREAVEHQLGRIIASDSFRSSGRLSAFLRFVVERAVAGDRDSLKESVIGTEALGKAPDFDPRTDPAVRVTAGRVRKRLKEYYDVIGNQDPVIILLPPSGYVPEITFRRAVAAQEDEPVRVRQWLGRLRAHFRATLVAATAVAMMVAWLMAMRVTAAGQLRSSPGTLTAAEAKAMIETKRFYTRGWNEQGGTWSPDHRSSVSQGIAVVADRRYSRLWQKAGSVKPVQGGREAAVRYVAELNERKVGGFTDWRLPSLEEALSLMMRPEHSQGYSSHTDGSAPERLHLTPAFDAISAPFIWTIDSAPDARGWVVYYLDGYPSSERQSFNAYVRAVRTQR